MNKFRLWLLAHGIEFSFSDQLGGTPYRKNQGNIYRQIFISINHRYYGVDLMVVPFRGVFKDELNTPHAEIAAQYKQEGQE